MQIGKLDRYVRIEQKVVTRDDDYGSEVITWDLYKECWAQVQDITTRMQEQTNNDLRLLKQPCKVLMRYDPSVNATMRLVLLDRDNRVLNIVTKPAEIGRRQAIEFTCEDYSEHGE